MAIVVLVCIGITLKVFCNSVDFVGKLRNLAKTINDLFVQQSQPYIKFKS